MCCVIFVEIDIIIVVVVVIVVVIVVIVVIVVGADDVDDGLNGDHDEGRETEN